MDSEKVKDFHNAYISGDDKKLDKLWKQVAPKTLVKFFSATYMPNGENYSLKSLEDKTLWLSSPKYFNDPLDCAINLDYNKECLELSYTILSSVVGSEEADRILNSDIGKQKLLGIGDKVPLGFFETHKKMQDSIFVSCFTEFDNVYSLTMWAHYAQNHKGFCAEYDFCDVKNTVEFGCIPIKYTNDYRYNLYATSVNEGVKNTLNYVFTKALEWQSEREWRLAKYNYESIDIKGFKVPFVLPKRIFLGCRVSDKLKEDIIRFCKAEEIELYQMKLKPGTYSIFADKLL